MGKQIYTIAIMEDKDYLNLHKQFPNIKKQDLHDSLGFADKEAGEAYIRKTSCKDVDNATIQHEIQELLAETSPHEKDGIRFGWFRKAFGFSSQPAVNFLAPLAAAAIPGIGPVLSGLLAAGTSAATQKLNTGKINPLQVGLSGVGGGILKAGMAPGIAASKEMGGGILGQVGSGLQSAVGIQSGAQKAVQAGLGNTTGLAKGMITSGVVTPTTPNLTPIGIAEAARMGVGAGVGAGLGSTLGTVSNVAPASNVPLYGGQAPSTIGQTPGVIGQVAAEAPKTLIQQAKGLVTVPNVLGAASLAGSMVTPSPQFTMPSSIEEIRKKLQDEQGLTELGKQAQVELGNILKSTPQELYPTANDAYYDAALRRTRENYSKAQEQMDAQYNLAGTYGSGEHMAQKAKMQEELARTESALASETEQRRFELATNAKYQAIQDSLGVDKNVMDDLVGLSGLDVQTAAMMYGAQAADVTAIRSALGTLGTELILRGTTGKSAQPTISLNLGK